MDETTVSTDVRPLVQAIKAELRLYMNGVMAQSLRERGLKYRLIFGVELPRLKEIAAGYPKSHDLAQSLWKEDIRECRILAGYLQPVDTFYPEIADIWLEQMHDTELVDYTCMNLFRHLPYASEKAFQWMAAELVLTQYCGFRLMCHLLSRPGAELNPRSRDEFIDQAQAAMASENVALRQAAQTALERLDEKK